MERVISCMQRKYTLTARRTFLSVEGPNEQGRKSSLVSRLLGQKTALNGSHNR